MASVSADLGAELGHKIGPLPVAGWIGAGVLGLGIAWYMRRHPSAPAPVVADPSLSAGGDGSNQAYTGPGTVGTGPLGVGNTTSDGEPIVPVPKVLTPGGPRPATADTSTMTDAQAYRYANPAPVDAKGRAFPTLTGGVVAHPSVAVHVAAASAGDAYAAHLAHLAHLATHPVKTPHPVAHAAGHPVS